MPAQSRSSADIDIHPKCRNKVFQHSFGIELEFLWWVRIARVADPEEHKKRHGIDPTKICIQSLEIGPTSFNSERKWAEQQIADAILKVCGAQVRIGGEFGAELRKHQPQQLLHPGYLYADDAWTIKMDPSVDEVANLAKHLPEPPEDGSWTNWELITFELASPALWDRPQSWQHVYEVVRNLQQKLSPGLRVNPTCGFHVHVGAGVNYDDDYAEWLCTEGYRNDDPNNNAKSRPQARKHTLSTLKRAAALFWAADGFLASIHVPERFLSPYARSIRIDSALAQDRLPRATGCSLRPSDSDYPILPILDDNAPDHDTSQSLLPLNRLASRSFPRILPSQRLSITRPLEGQRLNTLCRRAKLMLGPAPPPIEPSKIINKTALSGLPKIMQLRTRRDLEVAFSVAWAANSAPSTSSSSSPGSGSGSGSGSSDPLDSNSSPSSTRTANTTNTTTATTTTTAIDNNEDWTASLISRRLNYAIRWTPSERQTVEFREAGGTMSPLWACIWASICVGMFRFAKNADDARYWRVMERVVQAEKGEKKGKDRSGEEYDVVAMLMDMGMFAEALWVEKMVKTNPGSLWYPCLQLKSRASWGEEDDSGEERERLQR